MVNSNSFYQTKIEQENEELTAKNKKLDSLVSNFNLKVDSLVLNIESIKLKSDSSKLFICSSYLNKHGLKMVTTFLMKTKNSNLSRGFHVAFTMS